MIYAKTDEHGVNVSIEGESEEILHELAQIGSTLYNAARSGLEEGYYDDAEEDYDDCYEYCAIAEGGEAENIFRKLYPNHEVATCEEFFRDETGLYYIYVRLYRKGTKLSI